MMAKGEGESILQEIQRPRKTQSQILSAMTSSQSIEASVRNECPGFKEVPSACTSLWGVGALLGKCCGLCLHS